MSDAHDHADDGHVHVHVHSTKFYAGILGALLVLTVLTVAVSYVDIDGMLALGREVEGVGAWNLGVAVLIATMKASLVVLFFMHLKDDKRFNALVFVGSLLFIGVFFAYTMNDTNTRGTTGDPFNGVHVDPETGQRAPGGLVIPGEEAEPGVTPTLTPITTPPAPEAPTAAAEPEPVPIEAEGPEDMEPGGSGAAGLEEPSVVDAVMDTEPEAAAAPEEAPAEEPAPPAEDPEPAEEPAPEE